jgi:hypothetical protein
MNWFAYIGLFVIGAVMQVIAWRRHDGQLGHKAVFLIVIASVLAITHPF